MKNNNDLYETQNKNITLINMKEHTKKYNTKRFNTNLKKTIPNEI